MDYVCILVALIIIIIFISTMAPRPRVPPRMREQFGGVQDCSGCGAGCCPAGSYCQNTANAGPCAGSSGPTPDGAAQCCCNLNTVWDPASRTCKTPGAAPSSCTTNAECAGGNLCIGGLCKPFPVPIGAACDAAGQCVQNANCIESVCTRLPVPNGNACNGGGQCGYDAECIQAVCTSLPVALNAYCDLNEQCPSGALCIANACRQLPIPNGNACNSGGQCGYDAECIQAVCTSLPVPAGAYCDLNEQCDFRNNVNCVNKKCTPA